MYREAKKCANSFHRLHFTIEIQEQILYIYRKNIHICIYLYFYLFLDSPVLVVITEGINLIVFQFIDIDVHYIYVKLNDFENNIIIYNKAHIVQ